MFQISGLREEALVEIWVMTSIEIHEKPIGTLRNLHTDDRLRRRFRSARFLHCGHGQAAGTMRGLLLLTHRALLSSLCRELKLRNTNLVSVQFTVGN